MDEQELERRRSFPFRTGRVLLQMTQFIWGIRIRSGFAFVRTTRRVTVSYKCDYPDADHVGTYR